MVVIYSLAKVQGQRPVGLEDKVKTNRLTADVHTDRRTDGRTDGGANAVGKIISLCLTNDAR